ncbi:ermin-like [Osmerus eperlanus]|uniref:ermin-like n=1 Tax=Osmerus eperlanus TaxID=29151 RepID=UPI002E10EB89
MREQMQELEPNISNEPILSGEDSAAYHKEPGKETRPQTHARTSDPETQRQQSSLPTETHIVEAELLSPSGSEAGSPEIPPELETPAEPPGLEVSDYHRTPPLGIESDETLLQPGQPADPETPPGIEIPPVQDAQPTPAAEPECEPDTQTESETDGEREQVCTSLKEEVTSMDDTKRVTEKLTDQSGLGAGLKSTDEGPTQGTTSKQPEDLTEAEEEGACGGIQDNRPHSSQSSESSGEMVSCDEKNHPKVSIYKTVSYRKIRKGNTKQRIDEFESMINT